MNQIKLFPSLSHILWKATSLEQDRRIMLLRYANLNGIEWHTLVYLAYAVARVGTTLCLEPLSALSMMIYEYDTQT